MTTEIHIHGPVTVWRAKETPAKTRWRLLHKESPEDGEEILVRFSRFSSRYTMIAYLDEGELFDASGRLLFRSDAYSDDFLPEAVFDDRLPETVEWIPLDELLEGVER